jgi:hypothetical protein
MTPKNEQRGLLGVLVVLAIGIYLGRKTKD